MRKEDEETEIARKKLEEKSSRAERLGFSPNAKKVFKISLDESSSSDEKNAEDRRRKERDQKPKGKKTVFHFKFLLEIDIIRTHKAYNNLKHS